MEWPTQCLSHLTNGFAIMGYFCDDYWPHLLISVLVNYWQQKLQLKCFLLVSHFIFPFFLAFIFLFTNKIIMTESNTKSCQCVDLSIQFNDIAPMEPKKMNINTKQWLPHIFNSTSNNNKKIERNCSFMWVHAVVIVRSWKELCIEEK